MKINRQSLINVHLCLAAFFLPFALMFLLTGSLYTWSIKGTATARQEVVALSEPLTPDLDVLTPLATEALARIDVAPPSGDITLRKAGTSFQLEWGGVSHDVVLRPTANANEALLIINQSGLHRRFVQLHKGKGSALSKVVSVVWSAGLLAMFASGLAMAWAVPKFRRLALISGAAGIAAFACYFLLG